MINIARSQKIVLQVRSAREETASLELTVTSNHSNSKIMRPTCQSSTVLTFIKCWIGSSISSRGLSLESGAHINALNTRHPTKVQNKLTSKNYKLRLLL